MSKEEIVRLVDDIIGEVWDVSTRTIWINLALTLYEKGVSIEEIRELLESAFWSAAAEYGG